MYYSDPSRSRKRPKRGSLSALDAGWSNSDRHFDICFEHWPWATGGWNFSDSVGQDPSLLQATVFAAATSPSGQNGDGHDGSGPGSFGPMGSGSGGGGGGGSVFPSTGGGSSGSPPSTGGPPASPN